MRSLPIYSNASCYKRLLLLYRACNQKLCQINLLHCPKSNQLKARHIHSTIYVNCQKEQNDNKSEETFSRSKPRRRFLSPTRRLTSLLSENSYGDRDIHCRETFRDGTTSADSWEASSSDCDTNNRMEDSTGISFSSPPTDYQARTRPLSKSKGLSGILPVDFWTIQDTHVTTAGNNGTKTEDDLLDNDNQIPTVVQSDHFEMNPIGDTSQKPVARDSITISSDEKDNTSNHRLLQNGDLFISEYPNRLRRVSRPQKLRLLKECDEYVKFKTYFVEREKLLECDLPCLLTLPDGKQTHLRRPSLPDFCVNMKRHSFIAHPQVNNLACILSYIIFLPAVYFILKKL